MVISDSLILGYGGTLWITTGMVTDFLEIVSFIS